MIGLPAGSELIIIFGVALLLFGPSQIPKIAKSLGQTFKILKDTTEGKFEDDEENKLP